MKQSKKYLFYISQDYSFAILRPLQEKVIASGDEVFWFVEGKAVNRNYFTLAEKVVDTIDQINIYAPDIVIGTANNIPTFIPGLKVCVFHGFDAGKLDSRGNNDHFKIRGCYDLYCTQGPSTTQPFKKLKEQYNYFNVIETGWPALDPLFKEKAFTRESRQPVIFLGSTFTRKLTQAAYLFPEVKRLSRTNRWKWIVSLHPKSKVETIDRYKSIQNENLIYRETDNMIPILQESDIMVGDTSSAITMFIVQNKPVISVNNINPDNYLIHINNAIDLEKSIGIAISRPQKLMLNIQKYNEITHPYTDGESSARVIKAIESILSGEMPLKKEKPLNVIKNIKFRKKLGYWKR